MEEEEKKTIFKIDHKHTKIKWWDKIILLFCKKQYCTDEQWDKTTTMVYKTIGDKIFILDHFSAAPRPRGFNCRCQINEVLQQ